MADRKSRRGKFVLIAAASALPLFAPYASAQQQTLPGSGQSTASQTAANSQSSSSTQSGSSSQAPSSEIEHEQKTGTSNDRLFWALPNFLSVGTKDVPRLTAKQKFKAVARGAFDYSEFPWYAMIAGVNQAENSEPSYGQGFEGYGKRYATTFADGTVENFMVGAVLPSALRQDPRYYQMGKGGFWHRTGYALSRLFVTKSDSGRTEFNASEVFGSGIAAGISTFSYHPSGERNIGNACSVWGSEIAYDSITTMLKEFWPDIRHHFTRKKKDSGSPQNP